MCPTLVLFSFEIQVLWPPHAKCWLIGKDSDAGRDWGQRRRNNRGWDGWMASLTRWTWVWVNSGRWDGQGGLASCNSWGCKELDTTERLNWTELNWCSIVLYSIRPCFYHLSHPHLGTLFALALSFHFLESFLHWSPVVYWAPTDLESSSFSILSFSFFILFMGFSRQEC